MAQGTLAVVVLAPRVCVRWRFDAEFPWPPTANPIIRNVKGQCGRQAPALRFAPRVCVRWRCDAKIRGHRTSNPTSRHTTFQCGRQAPALRVGATRMPMVAARRGISGVEHGHPQWPPRQKPVRATSPRTAGWRHECACGGVPTRSSKAKTLRCAWRSASLAVAGDKRRRTTNSQATALRPARRAAHPAQRATSARTIIHNRVTPKPPRVDAGHPVWETTEPMEQRVLPGTSTVPRPESPQRQCGPVARTAPTSHAAAPISARLNATISVPVSNVLV